MPKQIELDISDFNLRETPFNVLYAGRLLVFRWPWGIFPSRATCACYLGKGIQWGYSTLASSQSLSDNVLLSIPASLSIWRVLYIDTPQSG